MSERCKNAVRHWFAYYGMVGTSAPTCRHCGAPNPRYDRERDPKAALDWASSVAAVSGHAADTGRRDG